MKKCPFCNADIQENARFCLYCMTPLVEKTVIMPRRGKIQRWWLPVTVAILLLAVVLWRIGTTPGASKDSSVELSGTPTDTTPVIPENTTSWTPQDTVAATEETASDNGDQGQSHVPPSGQTFPQSTGNTTPTRPTVTPTQPAVTPTQPTTTPTQPTTAPTQPTATPTQPTSPPTQVTDPPAIDYGNGTPGTEGYRTQTSIRNWRPEDDGHMPFVAPGSDVFFYSIASDSEMVAAGYSAGEAGYIGCGNGANVRCGIYAVPERINGIPVVYMEKFGISDIVKITLPKTILKLPSRAFYSCVEFKYLCLKGDQMTIPKDAFPPMDKRWYTIVIRSSANCKDENGRYWKNIAGEYGAVWEEWNG